LSIWIFIWFVVSAVLIGATLWSASILFEQKKAWAAYAKKKGLKFDKGTLMGPGQMQGMVGKYELAFFTAERQDADVRKRRYVTVLEIQLPGGIIDGAAAGTSEMVPFLKTLTRLRPREIKSEKWNPAFRFFSRNDKAMDAYLSEERIAAMNEILSVQNADILILFDGNEGLVRIETPDPLQHPAKIDKIVKRLLKNIQSLIPEDEEKQRLNQLIDQQSAQRAAAPVAPSEPAPEKPSQPEASSQNEHQEQEPKTAPAGTGDNQST